MVRYDPKIIQKFADRLYAQAVSIIFVLALVGAVGGAIGGRALAGYRPSETYMLIGGIAGALVGCAAGFWRSFYLRLRAQLALCQMAIEANTRAAAGAASNRPLADLRQ